MPRLRPPRDPVTLFLDGEPVVAERGEPAAVALVAAGHLTLARSPKFHRPRGPACLRAACDGCLARVDEVPNVMTCRVPSTEGLRIETQNVVGSKDTDLLRMADWFFPEGMNHHELFAGVPGVQRVLQGFARRVAGLGRLPGAGAGAGTGAGTGAGVRPARRRDLDVLVIGSGPAGMAAALALAARGRSVEVVDDDLAWGGSARILRGAGAGAWTEVLHAFGAAVAGSRVRVSLRTTAAGLYGDDVLLVTDGAERGGAQSAGGAEREGGAESAGGVEVVRAHTLVLAPGAQDGVVAFEGNDVPGVMSARAGCRLLEHGVTPGARARGRAKVVVASVDGGGPFGRAYAAADPTATVVQGVPLRVTGSARPRGVTIAIAGGDRTLPCDALLVDAPPAPAYELCAQAGAELVHEPRGFRVRTAAGGRVRHGVFAVGEAVGTPLEPAALAREAQRMAEASESQKRGG